MGEVLPELSNYATRIPNHPEPPTRPSSLTATPGLSENHRRQLFEESAISPDVAAERGYYTARTGGDVPQDRGPLPKRPGLIVPMLSPDGVSRSYQLRPDRKGKGPKYRSPFGRPTIVDCHPRMLEEARHGTSPLLITEGGKTGDAATSRGIATLVLAGVDMWNVPKVKPKHLRPCFDHVQLIGRPVFVAFDSDCMTKENVQRALSELVPALEARGADVKVIYLPDAPDGSKQGIDDYLAAGGTVREMFALARRYEPADVGRIRLSRDERLRARVEDLGRRWWREEWKGRGGHSERDVAQQLIEAAARTGKIHADGLRVRVSWGKLQVGAKVARNTLAKALDRLEERGFCYRDNEGRQADKTGAFVLRAKVDQYGERATQATQGLQERGPGGLPLRAPRLRWSRPKYTPRRGTVRGTRKVREGKPPESRERIERLGKIRGAVVDALEVAGGTLTLRELCEVLHRSRPRDVRRRTLPMLEEAGIIETSEAGDVITLADDWTMRLDAARDAGGEIEADELAESRRKRNSRAYHRRHEAKTSNPSAAGLEAVRRSREKAREHRREHLVGWVEDKAPAALSPLAAALRAYLDKHPRDARQPAGWIGSTLWALELYRGKPTPSETAAAIEELGGERYLRGLLERVRGVA